VLNMSRVKLVTFLVVFSTLLKAQMNVYRDTISVFESGAQLTNPWAGGINFSSFSQIDLNQDGKKDIVAFDKVCNSGGKLRAFLNVGSSGNANYKHAPEYQNQFPAVTDWALFYDYNMDGKEDLFTYTTGGIKVYQNKSIGTSLTFSLVSSLLKSDYNPTGATNKTNIPCNPVGLPGIADVDGDGDLDILTYSVFGIRVEYHQNQSKELYGHADSLVFDMVDDCWGDFQENSCQVDLYQCPYMKMFQNAQHGDVEKVLHSGSCIMCFDRDSDGDVELVLGDVSCSTVFFVENTGSSTNAHITDTTKLFPNFPNKGSTTTIKMNSFPCTYYLDVDNDGKKDLLASPNSIAGAENYQSVWYYKNTSANNVVDFSFQKKTFLQDEMIELGEGAFPVLFDANADGKKDLLIGNVGYYISGTNRSKIAYYQNIGSLTAPSFSLITKDYQALSTFTINAMTPTFGDLDADGDMDLITGDAAGQLHYFQNSAGAGNPAVFNTHIIFYSAIDVGNFSAPQLFDVDKNGTLDLLIGSQNGKIAFYKNTGTASSPSFSLQTASFGGVDVKQSGYITGFSMPFMYHQGSVSKLLVGSEIGNLYLYDNIDGNLTGSFNKVDTNLYKINDGARCAPYFEDITADGLRDLFLGNYAGGVAFFNAVNKNGVGVNEIDLKKEVNVYPNPASNKLTVAFDDNVLLETSIQLIDVLGQIVFETKTFNKAIAIDVSGFKSGIYFIKIQRESEGNKQEIIKKIIVQ